MEKERRERKKPCVNSKLIFCTYIYICACVRERKKEKKRTNRQTKQQYYTPSNSSKNSNAPLSLVFLLLSLLLLSLFSLLQLCVDYLLFHHSPLFMYKKERKKKRERKYIPPKSVSILLVHSLFLLFLRLALLSLLFLSL